MTTDAEIAAFIAQEEAKLIKGGITPYTEEFHEAVRHYVHQNHGVDHETTRRVQIERLVTVMGG
ncbi:hypothetical protein [Celeribacter naphthalenivorans]|uniref:hypothetical protein n=1 Tax=Celeribacter naphthalenivorans TaxID=1614694 RepID=UPI001CFC0AC5|nr:hypothetical protein [Celeribacter naphthalenivorans]